MQRRFLRHDEAAPRSAAQYPRLRWTDRPSLSGFDDQIGNPALEVAHSRVTVIASHQALPENIGVEQQAAALCLLLGNPTGEKQLAGAPDTLGIDFLDHRRSVGIASRPFAHREFDPYPLGRFTAVAPIDVH